MTDDLQKDFFSNSKDTQHLKNDKIKYGLKFKLSLFVILLIIAVVSIIASVLTYLIIKREEKQLSDQLNQNMNLSIDYLSSSVRDAIVLFDDLLLLDTVGKVSGFNDVEYVIITDNKNEENIVTLMMKLKK